MHNAFKDDDYLYMVMEYIPGGTLAQTMLAYSSEGMPKEFVQFYAAQLVLTLEYLQASNVAHRDFKPANIMLDSRSYIKLIDFGEAKIVDPFVEEEKKTNSRRGSVQISDLESSSDAGSYFGKMLKKQQKGL